MENLLTANIRSRPTRTFISILAVALGVILMLVISGIVSGTLNDYLGRTIATGANFMLQSGFVVRVFAPLKTLQELRGTPDRVTIMLIKAIP